MIGFAQELVPLVKNGKKTLTYRFGDKYDFLEIGDCILTKNSSTGEAFAELEIINKEHTTFGKLPIQRKGHEVYKSHKEMKQTFEKYYQIKMRDSAPILVLEFKVSKLL